MSERAKVLLKFREVTIIRKKDNKYVELFDISEYYPFLFWTQCNKCGDLIKREKMWVIESVSQRWGQECISRPSFYKFFCKECFKDNESGKKELHEYCQHKVKGFTY